MSDSPSSYFDGPHGRLAYRFVTGAGSKTAPTIIWLGGFKSDMTGTKAAFLDQWAQEQKRSFLRFDYSGHGESDGAFEDGCISHWAEDAAAIIKAKTEGPLLLVGSSMGGWIACLVAQRMPKRIAGAVFIAPAPDFTEALMWPAFSEEMRETIMRDGRLEQPSDYSDEPTIITRKLIEDGRENLVLHDAVAINGPVRILQGMNDPDVPYAHALRLAEALRSDDVLIAINKSGDHSLSAPQDLQRLAAAVQSITG